MKSSDQPGGLSAAVLAQTLDQMWMRFLPEIRERVVVLETAAAAESAHELTPAGREEVHAVAHKLAGTLGMFGLSRGTELARELEVTYSQESSLDPGPGKRLAAIAAEIRTIVESRPTKSQA